LQGVLGSSVSSFLSDFLVDFPGRDLWKPLFSPLRFAALFLVFLRQKYRGDLVSALSLLFKGEVHFKSAAFRLLILDSLRPPFLFPLFFPPPSFFAKVFHFFPSLSPSGLLRPFNRYNVYLPSPPPFFVFLYIFFSNRPCYRRNLIVLKKFVQITKQRPKSNPLVPLFRVGFLLPGGLLSFFFLSS